MYTLPYLILARLHRAALDARRGDRTWRFVGYSVLAGVTAGLAITIGLAFAWELLLLRLWPLAIVFGIVAVTPPVATVVLRQVAVPSGRVKLAFVLARVSRPGPDPEAFALCAAAWAYARRPSAAGETWLLARRDARDPLGDAEVVMTAFLALGHGNHDTARTLLGSVAMLVEEHPAVRELAGEWLAIDAAERGEWAAVHEAGSAVRYPASPLTLLLEGIAARFANADAAPSDLELLARWLVAPHRRATWPLLRLRPPVASGSQRATPPTATDAAATTGTDATDSTDPTDPTDDPDAVGPTGTDGAAGAALARAITEHLALVATAGSPTAAALATTVRAWDLALADGDVFAWLFERAVYLDAPPGAVDRALREVATSVADELARTADAARLGTPAGATGAVGSGLSRRLRHGRLDALEAGFTRWKERAELHKRAGMSAPHRHGIDEWREFVALETAYRDACTAGGLDLRRLAFPRAFEAGNAVAVWLWNTLKEYAISHAISRWLLREALVVGDAQAIDLGYTNCALKVHTRTGVVVDVPVR